jgi:[protein-PII] uridylyltransferase
MEIQSPREIIHRRSVSDGLAKLSAANPDALRTEMVAYVKAALQAGNDVINTRFLQSPNNGKITTYARSYLVDQIIRLIFDFTCERLFPHSAHSTQSLCIMALGGYGRQEMAPYSDVDIGFLTQEVPNAHTKALIESLLLSFWDVGFKVGHNCRTLDESIGMARKDLSICTALLESRPVWGDETLYDALRSRFVLEVLNGEERNFVTDKLAERDTRHKRMGDSRYVVEPNVKEGKGGLRDLHTLFWIGKFVYRAQSAEDLVQCGLLTAAEYRRFAQAENFMLAVRCHLHIIAHRGEDRLTFDVQREIAERMNYKKRPGRSAVERFMKHYFLVAKSVGYLTGVFLAHLDEKFAAKGARFGIPVLARFRRTSKKLNGFVLDRGRLSIPEENWFVQDPVRLIELFVLANSHELEIHPHAMRSASSHARYIDNDVRTNKRANALFLDLLTSEKNPEATLRWMNESGVFGRFIPDFGRVVAQMQFDMYHHYTVDEHSIHAIGLLSDIESGKLAQDHPIAAEIMQHIVSRRVLFVAVLLHDIAKGRGGDHSILGAEVAEQLCPRLGLTASETETVAWLVRYHLLMPDTAFRRDISDSKTISDFAAIVQSPGRLKLLLALTVVDIRAVGPGVWNGWKRQLLSDLFEAAEEVLRLGYKHKGRAERIASKQAILRNSLNGTAEDFAHYADRLPDSYWIAEPDDILLSNALLVQEAGSTKLVVKAQPYPSRAATLVSVYTADHAGLFYRLAGGIHLANATIIDARIHTTQDGMALDNFLVQDAFGNLISDEIMLARIEKEIAEALISRHKLNTTLVARSNPKLRVEAFSVVPNVVIDNSASNRYTVVEVSARDRPALLYALAFALFDSQAMIHTAHIATYGERAVDTFYITDLLGSKIVAALRLKSLERRLLDASAQSQEQRQSPVQAIAI